MARLERTSRQRSGRDRSRRLEFVQTKHNTPRSMLYCPSDPQDYSDRDPSSDSIIELPSDSSRGLLILQKTWA